MENKKKDYLTKTVTVQFIICAIIFGSLFGLSKADGSLFGIIKDTYSELLEENVTYEEVEEVFSGFGKYVKENVYDEKQGIEVELAVGGEDVKVDGKKEIPENVSLSKYNLKTSMVKPVSGTVSSKFGFRVHPITGEYGFHSGIDLAADTGTPIYSAFDGKVIVADKDQWNGNFIKIEHGNDIMTVYCHCNKLFVKKGNVVRAGEKIAEVGSTGSSTGPHLHFEFRINNISYNPSYALDNSVNAI